MKNKRSKHKQRRDVDGLGQLIAKECACWKDGKCLGAAADNSFCMPLPKCLVLLGERCMYFEECLLPLSLKERNYHGAWDQYQQTTAPDAESTLEELSEEERGVYEGHPFVGDEEPTAPAPGRLCECGEPLDAGRQLCPQCQFQRRKDSYRRAKEQKPEKVAHGSGVL